MSSPRAPISPQRAHALGVAATQPERERELPSTRALTRPPHPGSYAARAAAEAEAAAQDRALQRSRSSGGGGGGGSRDWDDRPLSTGGSAGSRPGSARMAQRPLTLDGGDGAGPPLPYYPSAGSRPTSAGYDSRPALPRTVSSPVQRQHSFPAAPIRSLSPHNLPRHQQHQMAAEYPQYDPHPHSHQQHHQHPHPHSRSHSHHHREHRPPSPQRYASMQQAVQDVQQSRFSSFVPQEHLNERGGLARPVSVVVVEDHEVAYSPYPAQQEQQSARGQQQQAGQIVGLRPRTPVRGASLPPPLPDYDPGLGHTGVYSFGEAEEDPAAGEYPLEGAPASHYTDAGPTPYEREYSRSQRSRKVLTAQHPMGAGGSGGVTHRLQLSQEGRGSREVIPPLSPALMGVSTSSVMSQPGGSTARPSIFIPASPVGAANGGRGAGIHATPATRAAAAAGFNTNDVGGSPRYAAAGQQQQQRAPLSPVASSPTSAAGTGPAPSPSAAAGAPAVLPASLSTTALVGHDPTDMDMIVVKIAGCFDPNPNRLLAALCAFLLLILLFVCIAFGVSWHTGVKTETSWPTSAVNSTRTREDFYITRFTSSGDSLSYSSSIDYHNACTVDDERIYVCLSFALIWIFVLAGCFYKRSLNHARLAWRRLTILNVLIFGTWNFLACVLWWHGCFTYTLTAVNSSGALVYEDVEFTGGWWLSMVNIGFSVVLLVVQVVMYGSEQCCYCAC